jgi:hypothetical protein
LDQRASFFYDFCDHLLENDGSRDSQVEEEFIEEDFLELNCDIRVLWILEFNIPDDVFERNCLNSSKTFFFSFSKASGQLRSKWSVLPHFGPDNSCNLSGLKAS